MHNMPWQVLVLPLLFLVFGLAGLGLVVLGVLRIVTLIRRRSTEGHATGGALLDQNARASGIWGPDYRLQRRMVVVGLVVLFIATELGLGLLQIYVQPA